MRTLWTNGTVCSMDAGLRRYEAVGVQGDRICFLGDRAQARLENWDRVEDLEGGFLFPGFHDTHLHLLYYAFFLKNLSLFGVPSISALIDRARDHLRRHRPGFLLGMGWNQETLAERRMPTREDLDRISTEIPICLLRTCAHVAVCNSRMLRLLPPLDRMSPEVARHVDVERGLLREEAMRLYMEVMPQLDQDYLRRLVTLGQHDLNAKGITCVHSDDLQVLPGVSPFQVTAALKGMDRRGELTVRIYEQCLVEEEDFDAFLPLRTGPGDCLAMFRTGPRKLLQDGSLGAKSASMLGGYLGEEDNHGISIYTPQQLYQRVLHAHKNHMDVAIHGIGDGAIAAICDAVERCQREYPWPQARHGIVHAQITTPALLRRMKALGLQAYVQPIFIEADMDVIGARMAPRDIPHTYNWRTMLELGIPVSGGSDCPVEPFDVLYNLQAAVTRRKRDGSHPFLPQQALSVEQGLRLFTSAGAWASRDEDLRGTLELNKLADLTLLSQDPFAVDPGALGQIQVRTTAVGGRVVYRRDGP